MLSLEKLKNLMPAMPSFLLSFTKQTGGRGDRRGSIELMDGASGGTRGVEVIRTRGLCCFFVVVFFSNGAARSAQ